MSTAEQPCHSLLIIMPSHQDYKIKLQVLQSERLRRDHADLAAERQYEEIATFFFEEMYGPRDFSNRDEQAHRLRQFVHMAPGLAIRDVEQILDLLELTKKLDDSVVAELIALNAPVEYDEKMYEHAYRRADNYDERVAQLDLIRGSLNNVYRLAKNPVLKMVLHRTAGLAQVAGMADIHRFLLSGYQAIQPVKDIHRFIETIIIRERVRLDRIYEVKRPARKTA